MQEFQVILNYDVVDFFFPFKKALLELCFCSSGIHIL